MSKELTQKERLLLLEKEVKDVKEDVNIVIRVAQDNHDLLLGLPEKLDKRYLTRRESAAIVTVLTLLIGIVGFVVA